jgi:single-stranded DNA-specific DHH superfamily exonuclease
MQLNCNNKLSEDNDPDKLLCGATVVYYVNRLCRTFKDKRDNYKALMRVDNPNCIRSGGKWKNRM